MNGKRYEDLAHAMQGGVAMEMDYKPEPTEPKHLRVGVNAAMVDHCGLVKLLIAKGVLTEEEYIAAITESMAEEVQRYEERLSKRLGGIVRLA